MNCAKRNIMKTQGWWKACLSSQMTCIFLSNSQFYLHKINWCFFLVVSFKSFESFCSEHISKQITYLKWLGNPFNWRVRLITLWTTAQSMCSEFMENTTNNESNKISGKTNSIQRLDSLHWMACVCVQYMCTCVPVGFCWYVSQTKGFWEFTCHVVESCIHTKETMEVFDSKCGRCHRSQIT